jgi:hypothetical protein
LAELHSPAAAAERPALSDDQIVTLKEVSRLLRGLQQSFGGHFASIAERLDSIRTDFDPQAIAQNDLFKA